MYGETMPAEVERIAAAIVDSAYKVHLTFGPGLLESVYEACLTHELRQRGLTVERQVAVPIVYDGELLDEGFRIDLRVNGSVIVEVKAVEVLLPVFAAQVKTYLKLTGHPLALLINFNVPLIKDGIKRVVLTENLKQQLNLP
jgi:GxxExxY protein